MSSLLRNTEDTYAGIGFTETYTGLMFSLEQPEFRIADIAHALSMLCRFNGHTKRFYSVAEHSILVCGIMQHMPGANPLEGLLHDATEAYLSDVPAPFKQFLPDWQAVDKALDARLRTWASVPVDKSEDLKRADWLALFIEAAELMPGQGRNFTDPHGLRAEALEIKAVHGMRLGCWDPEEAELQFLDAFVELSREAVVGHG